METVIESNNSKLEQYSDNEDIPPSSHFHIYFGLHPKEYSS